MLEKKHLEIIKKSTVSVSLLKNKYNDEPELNIGTAFSISKNHLLTAYHVVKDRKLDSLVKIENSDYLGTTKVVSENEETDLAILELIDGDDHLIQLEISKQQPQLGDNVLWGGYPKLIGEYSELRLRCARGMISSDCYREERGIFFEVDGIFNPSHSGSPILSYDEGKVIGVVSASAGNPERIMEQLQDYNDVLSFLSYLASRGPGRMMSRNLRIDGDSLHNFAEMVRRTKIEPRRIVSLPEGKWQMNLRVADPIIGALANLKEMIEVLASGASETYQMGLGIATGGEPFLEFISPFIP